MSRSCQFQQSDARSASDVLGGCLLKVMWWIPVEMWVIRLTCACTLEFPILGCELQLNNTSELEQPFWSCDYLHNLEVNVSTQFTRARSKNDEVLSKENRNIETILLLRLFSAATRVLVEAGFVIGQ